MQIGFSRRNAVRPASQKSRRCALQRRRLTFDCLEERRLLTGTLNTSPAQVLAVASYPGTNTTDPNTPSDTLDPATVAWTSNQAVAMDNNGDAVVVWDDSPTNQTGSTPTNQPTGQWTVNFKLYAEGTDPTTGATELTAGVGGPLKDMSGNLVPSTDEGSPLVAMAPTSGNFVVAWEQETVVQLSNIVPQNAFTTYVQLYAKDGTPLTNPIVVGKSDQSKLEGVAMNDNGFDVLYGSPYQAMGGVNNRQLTVQRYTSSGAANGGAIKVAVPNDLSSSSAISIDSKGDFVVGWSNTISSSNGWVYSLNWQRYTSTAKTAEKAVTENGFSYLPFDVNLAMDSNDDFVFTWNLGNGLQTQEISSSDGLGSQNTVDASASGGRTAIAMQPAGDYVLSWTDTTGGQSGSSSVYAATYSLNGTAETSAFVVYAAPNVSLNGRYYSLSHTPSAAIDPAGNVLTVNAGYFTDNTSTVYTDGGEFGQFYLDPPAPSASTGSPATSVPTGAISSSGATTAATDAVFAAYAYPEDDDTLG